MHIKAHTNNTDIHSVGNKKADELAYNACHLENIDLNLSEKTETKNLFSIESEICEIKKDIKDLLEMMKAVYDFENE